MARAHLQLRLSILHGTSLTILAIETSCDETAVAVLRGTELLASEVASQVALHAEFGGAVPEVASRNHLRMLKPVVQRALAGAGWFT